MSRSCLYDRPPRQPFARRDVAVPAVVRACIFAFVAALSLHAGVEEGLAAYRAGNFAVAIQEFRTAAENGNSTAQVSLGFMYLRGHGVVEDLAQAVHWLQLAAEQGVAPAQHSLALLYYEGRGVDRNSAIAANYFESAALQGLADAQFNLGVLNSRGDGVRQDDTLARFWYLKAAKQGVSDAQLALGLMYAQGQGGPADSGQAARWLGMAATAGNLRAQRLLESAFRAHPSESVVVKKTIPTPPPDSAPTDATIPEPPTQRPPLLSWKHPPAPISDKAFRNIQGRAAAGDAEAQFHLARHYMHGVSAPESPVRSYVWAERSARNGYPLARPLAEALHARLSRRQRSAARSMLDP